MSNFNDTKYPYLYIHDFSHVTQPHIVLSCGKLMPLKILSTTAVFKVCVTIDAFFLFTSDLKIYSVNSEKKTAGWLLTADHITMCFSKFAGGGFALKSPQTNYCNCKDLTPLLWMHALNSLDSCHPLQELVVDFLLLCQWGCQDVLVQLFLFGLLWTVLSALDVHKCSF